MMLYYPASGCLTIFAISLSPLLTLSVIFFFLLITVILLLSFLVISLFLNVYDSLFALSVYLVICLLLFIVCFVRLSLV